MTITLLDPLPPPATTHKGVRYRPDIDGLRTIAVLAVVLYHADIGPFSGGFVGVDVFFVISGFLIMSTLASDLAAGRFSILTFYERRIRRIFPALFTMMAVVTAVAALVVLPGEFAAHGKSLIAAATSLSNVFFYMTAGTAGYFDNGSETRLLLHTWSLSVEEQFYVLLPVALLLLRGRRRRTSVIALSLFAAGSFVLSLVAVAYRPMDAFYLVLPRAWELLAGCLLAVIDVPPLARRWLREAAAALGVALIAIAALGYDRHTAFPGAAALLPVAGALLLIHAGKSGGPSGSSNLVARVLSTSPSVYIGRISYSLYLWHWPIIVFVGQMALVQGLEAGELTARAKILIVVASFAAAILSYHLIEQPFRRKGAISRVLTKPRLVGGGVAAALTAACCGAVIVAGAGFPGRFDAATAKGRIVAANLQRAHDEADSHCYHFKRRYTDAAEFGRCPSDRPKAHNVLVLGDSHAGSLRPLVRTLADEGQLGDRGTVSAVVAACPLDEHMNNRLDGYYCASSARLAFARAMEADVDAVLFAFSPWWTLGEGQTCASTDDRCGTPLARGEAEARFVADLTTKVHAMRTAGKIVILQLPLPIYNKSIPSLQLAKATYGPAKALFDKLGMSLPLRRSEFASMRNRIEALARAESAFVFDPRPALCRGDSCASEQASVSLYMDNNHLADSEIGLLREPLEKALANALQSPPSALTARRTSGIETTVASTTSDR